MPNSSRSDKNEGTHRSREGGGEPAVELSYESEGAREYTMYDVVRA